MKSQNLGPWVMKSSQSNFDLQSPSSYLARSYLIATVSSKCSGEKNVRFFSPQGLLGKFK